MSTPTREELEHALNVLGRAIAPYVADALNADAQTEIDRPATENTYSEGTVAKLIERLGPELASDAYELFDLLREPPHEVDSLALSDRTGVSQSALAGKLLRPLRQATDQLGLPRIWNESGRTRRGTVWTATDADQVQSLAATSKRRCDARRQGGVEPHQRPRVG